MSRGLGYPVVQLAGFPPKTEFAGADVASHAFGGGADAREFVIVDHTCAVHRDVVDETALDEVDDVAVDSRAQHMRSHHQNAGCAQAFGFDETPRDFPQVLMLEWRSWIVEL